MRLFAIFSGNRFHRSSRLLVRSFFVLYLFTGLLIFRDYGISYDEPWGRENGLINVKFIGETLAPVTFKAKNYCVNCPSLHNYPDADHGPLFEIVPTVLEGVLQISDMQHVYLLRHLCSFLLFYIGCIFFYLLLKERFRHPLWGLAGVLMLVLSPRIFAESFYNAKDLPFLSLSIIAVYALIRFLKTPSMLTSSCLALACAFTVDVRILGLLFPALTIGFTILHLRPFRPDGIPVRKAVLLLLVFAILFTGFTIAFWPYLWHKPFSRFGHLLTRTSAYPWTGEVLYMGRYYPAQHLPWHYLPVWIFISTPVWYTLLMVTGVASVILKAVQNRFRLYANATQQQDLIMLAYLTVPVAAALALQLVLYDSWRHLYFIYPAFIYLSTLGFYRLYKLTESHSEKKMALKAPIKLAYFVVLLWLFFTGQVAFWILKNHPHQQVYFSMLEGSEVRQEFELDYWGLSYKQGLKYVLAASDKPTITVMAENLPGFLNQNALPAQERQRLKFTKDLGEADYHLTEYRWHPQDYPHQHLEVYAIIIDGYRILSVFKMK